MEAQLDWMIQMRENACSDECLRLMKRIFKKLRVLILQNELDRVERKRMTGKLSGKQAQHEKARVKKSWR